MFSLIKPRGGSGLHLIFYVDWKVWYSHISWGVSNFLLHQCGCVCSYWCSNIIGALLLLKLDLKLGELVRLCSRMGAVGSTWWNNVNLCQRDVASSLYRIHEHGKFCQWWFGISYQRTFTFRFL